MKKRMNKHPAKALLAVCYGGWLTMLLLLHLAGLVQNKMLYANGTFTTQTLTTPQIEQQFELIDMELRGDVFVTLSGDPQFLLKDAQQRVDSVVLTATYGQNPQVLNAFYTVPGQDYTVRKMVYAQQNGHQSTFYLPQAGGQSLRIDPGTLPGNAIAIESITLNSPRPWYMFFDLSAGEWIVFVVIPGLLASFFWSMRQLFPMLKK